jgi:hypothetical protein
MDMTRNSDVVIYTNRKPMPRKARIDSFQRKNNFNCYKFDIYKRKVKCVMPQSFSNT